LKDITLIFSGKQGGGFTVLNNLVKGFALLKSKDAINLSVITLYRFKEIEESILTKEFNYIYLTKERKNIFHELFLNLNIIFLTISNIFKGKSILFTMTHPNLSLMPIYRIIASFTTAQLLYIKHNPPKFRHVQNILKNLITTISDYIATYFSHKLLFHSKNVMKSYSESKFISKRAHYIGFGYNLFSKKKTSYKSSDSKKINFLFFGRALPYKGLDVLIEAISLVKPSSDLSFTIASSGIPEEQFDALKTLSDKYEIILYNKWINDEDLHLIFLSTDCVIIPYKEISQSGPLLCSIGYNKPVIGSDLIGIREFLNDKTDSLLFSNNNAQNLAEKIELFFSNPYIRETLNNNTYSNRIRFSWDKVCSRINGIL
jgi:glycosyltransferase involved in cell wall biosynthesis